MFARLLGASVVTNILLAVSAYFLFSSNTRLNVDVGEKRAALIGYEANEKVYVQKINQCAASKTDMITAHDKAVLKEKRIADARVAQIKAKVADLMADRNRILKAVETIQLPAARDTAEGRIVAIEAMIDSYIDELDRAGES